MIRIEAESIAEIRELLKIEAPTVQEPEVTAWYDNKPTVLCLRAVDADGTAYNGFKWPATGLCEAPNWEPTAKCGYGLHGYL